MVTSEQLELNEYHIQIQKCATRLQISENFASTVFKALIRETSVYKHYVELKEGVLTKQGFFDLSKAYLFI